MKHRPMGFHAQPESLSLEEIKELSELVIESRSTLAGVITDVEEFCYGPYAKKEKTLQEDKYISG